MRERRAERDWHRSDLESDGVREHVSAYRIFRHDGWACLPSLSNLESRRGGSGVS